MRKITQATTKFLLVAIVLIATNFGFGLDAESKTPKIQSAECRKIFLQYEHMAPFRAFALSSSGRGCGTAQGHPSKKEAARRAIKNCQKWRNNKRCRIIASSNKPFQPPIGYNELPDGAGLLVEIPMDADIGITGDYAKEYSEATRKRAKIIPKYHPGIDFVRKNGPSEGLQIIAAAAGKVIRANTNKCSGGGVTVRSKFKQDGKYIHVGYSHLGKLSVRKGQRIKRGQVIGELSRGNTNWPCMGSTTHLHFSVRRSPSANDYLGYLNPNEFWVEGEGKLTCFDEAKNYDNTSLNLTSPMKCDPFPEAQQLAKPEFSGEIYELRALLKSGDKELVKEWQEYFRSLGYYPGGIDGIYGAGTEKAIESHEKFARKFLNNGQIVTIRKTNRNDCYQVADAEYNEYYSCRLSGQHLKNVDGRSMSVCRRTCDYDKKCTAWEHILSYCKLYSDVFSIYGGSNIVGIKK